MVVRVGGRIPIRHPGRCEMGKWDKLSWRGGPGEHVAFFGALFFSSAINGEVQKRLAR